MLRRGIALAITAGSLVLTSSQPSATRVVAPRGGDAGPPQTIYAPTSKEYYLAQDQFDFARPGYHIKVNGVTIGADRKPVVDVNLTDDLGAPLDRLGVQTPGACSASFILSWYDPATRNYTSYATRIETAAPPSTMVGNTAVQATTDSRGVFKDLDIGHFTYTFKTVLPAGFDQTKTHTLGIYGTRTLPADILDGKAYVSNTEFDFRPDGQAVTAKWDEIQQANSCNQCHAPLAAHGGSRRDAKLCVLCHSPQTTDADTGNTVDMRVFIHKIHRGSSLPSVKAGTPYQIIGFNQGVNDFSTVVFPQDIRNCANCHEGRNPTQKPTQFDVWYTKPSRAACGSCHDDIDWVTGANHPAGAQADDSACASCHAPQGDQEYDASIMGAHTVPYRSTQLKGLNAKIVSVAGTAPGQKPTVVFQITNGDGSAVDPSKLGNVFLVVAGPTTDYTTVPFSFFESAKAASFDGQKATYTLTNAIPASATGTWAVALTALRTVTLNPAPRQGPATVGEAALNPVVYVAVTDSQPVPRRTVVARDNCNKCHDQLALHGRNFLSPELCVLCHNPKGDDSLQRPADKNPPESIAFKRFIHRIHSGENLTQDFTIYGFGHSINNFNDVRYPGDREDCVQCHTATTTYSLPLATGTIPVVTQRDYFSPQGPATAACLGCHDNIDAAAHAFLNTVMTPFFGEACATCHGTGKDWDVVKVHAR